MKQENKKKILSVFWEAAGLFPDCLGSIHTRKAVTGDRNDKTLPQIMTELLVYVGINPEYNQLIWVAPTAKRHIADELHLSMISLSLSETDCRLWLFGDSVPPIRRWLKVVIPPLCGRLPSITHAPILYLWLTSDSAVHFLFQTSRKHCLF